MRPLPYTRWFALLFVAVVLHVVPGLRAALRFNGTNSYATINGSFMGGATVTNFTVDFWFKPEVTNRVQFLFNKIENWKELSIRLNADGSVGFLQVWPNVYRDVVSGPGMVKSNVWQHLAIVGQGASCSLYLNAQLVATAPINPQTSFNAVMSGDVVAPMSFGFADYATLPDGNWFQGLLFDFKVWNRALSLGELSDLQTGGVPFISSTGLMNLLGFKETLGIQFADSVGTLGSSAGSVFNTIWTNDSPYSASNKVIRVPQDQPTIAAAVNLAVSGDTVLISDGTYNERSILLTKAITLTSANGNAATSVNGQNLGGIFQVNLPPGDSGKVTIQGITIKGGIVGGGWAAGIRRFAGRLEVRDCLFEQNYANGGVIDARGAADYSAYEQAKALVVDCVFRNNSSENFAGVLGVTAVRCLFYGNTGFNNPAVIGSSWATNCTAYNNTGGAGNPWTTGGATSSTLVNCILWANSGFNGQQIDGTAPGTVDYSTVQGGHAGTGNLSLNPLFLNAATGDFHLQANSPAINAGHPMILDSDGTRSDMGAYGGAFDYCSPHKATATPTLVNGLVAGATIVDPGCGYTNAPTVLIQGGGGSGATATAVMSGGRVVAINIVNAGCCYTNSPNIVIGSPPFVPTVSIAVSRVKVTQNAVLGRNYVLEASTNLVIWGAVGPQFNATSEIIVSEFDVDLGLRFFRIRQVP